MEGQGTCVAGHKKPAMIYSTVPATIILVPAINSSTLHKRCDGDLGGDRTHNLQLRRLTLYPIELRDRDSDSSIHATTCQAGWKYERSIRSLVYYYNAKS